MAFPNIMKCYARAERGWIGHRVVAHAIAEDSASRGGDGSCASKPRAASSTDHVRLPMRRVD